MKTLLLLCVLGAILMSGTQAQANGVIGALGTTVNYQLSSNGRSYDAVAPFAVRAGYRFHFADVFGEYSYVKSSTGSDLISIGTQNQEFLLFIRKGDPTARNFKPFIAVGVGGHFQTVSTKFAQQTSNDPGAVEAIVAGVAGLDIRIVKQVELTLETRITGAESYSPNPLFGVGAFLNIVL